MKKRLLIVIDSRGEERAQFKGSNPKIARTREQEYLRVPKINKSSFAAALTPPYSANFLVSCPSPLILYHLNTGRRVGPILKLRDFFSSLSCRALGLQNKVFAGLIISQ